MNLENDLRRTLRRESPAPGFASRVMQRIDAGEPPAPMRGTSRRWWWRAAAASLLVTVLAGGWTAREIRQRREGERAKEQLLLAMRIAGDKVRYAQHEVRSIGSSTD